MAELKRICEALEGSVNDVALAAWTTGLRQLLVGRGEALPTHEFRAMVPVNVRNRASRLFVQRPL